MGQFMEAYITGTINRFNKYTDYEIVCITNTDLFGCKHFKIYRRYTDFYNFHSKIRKYVHELPPFPKKVYNKMKYEVVKERLCLLNNYIKYICYILSNTEANINLKMDKIEKYVVQFFKE